VGVKMDTSITDKMAMLNSTLELLKCHDGHPRVRLRRRGANVVGQVTFGKTHLIVDIIQLTDHDLFHVHPDSCLRTPSQAAALVIVNEVNPLLKVAKTVAIDANVLLFANEFTPKREIPSAANLHFLMDEVLGALAFLTKKCRELQHTTALSEQLPFRARLDQN